MTENGYKFTYTEYSIIDTESNATGVKVTGPKRITKFGMHNFCWPGCLTVMYDKEAVGLIQIADIKKNNDYAMWLKVIKKSKCYLLKSVLAEYRKGRSGSISTQGIKMHMKWHYKLFREVEGQNPVFAFINMVRNVAFAVFKKIFYVKEIK